MTREEAEHIDETSEQVLYLLRNSSGPMDKEALKKRDQAFKKICDARILLGKKLPSLS